MAWKILFYENSRGERPVQEFITTLSPSSQSKVIGSVRLLREFGMFLKMPHSKKITKNLYELRIRGKEEVRIFYAFSRGKIYLLHAFKKKSQRTPSKEIKLAEARLATIDK